MPDDAPIGTSDVSPEAVQKRTYVYVNTQGKKYINIGAGRASMNLEEHRVLRLLPIFNAFLSTVIKLDASF